MVSDRKCSTEPSGEHCLENGNNNIADRIRLETRIQKLGTVKTYLYSDETLGLVVQN